MNMFFISFGACTKMARVELRGAKLMAMLVSARNKLIGQRASKVARENDGRCASLASRHHGKNTGRHTKQQVKQPIKQPRSKTIRHLSKRQAGFSLVEVSIVTALMVILAIVGIPALQDYVIENKVPKVASDLQRFVARMKVAGIGGSDAPFANVDRRVLVNGMRGSSAVTVRGEGSTAVVIHGLGGHGTADHGAVSIAPAAVPDQPVGSAFSLTLDHVNHAACPMLATTLQRMASQVTLDGKSGEVIVKNDFAVPPMAYQPVLADAQCQRGDNNRFVFVFQ